VAPPIVITPPLIVTEEVPAPIVMLVAVKDPTLILPEFVFAQAYPVQVYVAPPKVYVAPGLGFGGKFKIGIV
jgi:hypothetical protein